MSDGEIVSFSGQAIALVTSLLGSVTVSLGYVFRSLINSKDAQIAQERDARERAERERDRANVRADRMMVLAIRAGATLRDVTGTAKDGSPPEQPAEFTRAEW